MAIETKVTSIRISRDLFSWAKSRGINMSKVTQQALTAMRNRGYEPVIQEKPKEVPKEIPTEDCPHTIVVQGYCEKCSQKVGVKDEIIRINESRSWCNKHAIRSGEGCPECFQREREFLSVRGVNNI